MELDVDIFSFSHVRYLFVPEIQKYSIKYRILASVRSRGNICTAISFLQQIDLRGRQRQQGNRKSPLMTANLPNFALKATVWP